MIMLFESVTSVGAQWFRADRRLETNVTLPIEMFNNALKDRSCAFVGLERPPNSLRRCEIIIYVAMSVGSLR